MSTLFWPADAQIARLSPTSTKAMACHAWMIDAFRAV
jgi:hypothetical protein